MKNSILILIIVLSLQGLHSQHFSKQGQGLSVKTFFHQQGLNYYLHDMDSSGRIYAIHYDTVTSSFNFGHEYTQIRLQIYDGVFWTFSKPIKLHNRHSIDAPRVLDIRRHGNDIYVCGSFDSTENDMGAGVLRFSNGGWQSSGANLLQTNPDYFEVNRAYSFDGKLLISGNFDSIPGIRVNGLLIWDGTNWSPLGSAGTYGFRNLSSTSNVFFQVANDSLYAFNKNKITPDSIEIGGITTKKLAVFRNGVFSQIKLPAKHIAGISSYQQKLVVIPSSSLVYINSILWLDGGTWKSFSLPDSFYATSLAGTINTGNLLYLLFQNGDTKMMNLYAFNGSTITKLSPFKVADNYVPIESRNMKDEMSIAGNFKLWRKGNYNDSFNGIAKIIFKPRSIISGTTYLDLNNDKVRQVSEPALPFSSIYSIDNVYMAISDGNGKFNIDLPVNGSYTFEGLNHKGYVSNSSLAINPSADSIYTYDFGLIPEDRKDLSISIFSNTAHKAKQGFRTSYTVYLSNPANVQQSLDINIVHDTRCTDIQAAGFVPKAKANKGFKIECNISPRENMSYTFSCIYAVDSFELGEKVFVSGMIHLSDARESNNKDTVWQIVSAAFDPNIKVASPEAVVNREKLINYTIHFQNLGNDVATRVRVIDSFGSLLDISSIHFVGAQPFKPEQLLLDPRGVVEYRFNNINLPPAKLDTAKSTGAIYLTAKLSKKAKIGDSIFNKATIIFDYQKPIITNSAKVVYVKNISIPDIDAASGFNFYPNPGNGIFNYDNPGGLRGELQVFSSDGKLVYTTVLDEKGLVELPQTLANGVYILKIAGAGYDLGKIIVSE